jgi:hypothetical protein
MNKKTFDLQIETRGSKIDSKGNPNYIVKGYITVPNNPYSYKYFDSKGKKFSLKEMFTTKGMEAFQRKAMSKDIFVDALHEISTLHNTKQLLKSIQEKSGVDISQEANSILTSIKHSDIPIAKIHSMDIDDKGLFVETRLNPSYREVDDKHQKYFDAVWNSLQEGYLNKFSIDFVPKYSGSDLINGELVPKIDDVEVFGISFKQGAANEMCDITEVAIRGALEHTEEVKRMEEETIKKENEELKRQVSEMRNKEAESKRAEQDKIQKDLEESRKSLESQKLEMQKMKEDMEKKMSDMSKVKPTQTSVAPSESNFRQSNKTQGDMTVEKAMEIKPEIREPSSDDPIARYAFFKNPRTKPNYNGKIGLGEALHLQAMTNAATLEAPETRHWLQKRADDITVPRRTD